MFLKKYLYALLAFAAGAPFLASAHEVYILPKEVIDEAVREPAFSELGVIASHPEQFGFWFAVAVTVVVIVLLISLLRVVERALDPLLARLPKYAPVISRVTIGLAFIAGAYYDALFGPELPLPDVFGTSAPILRALLALIGAMFVVGAYVRLAALAGLAIFLAAMALQGTYLLTYTNYLGEILLLGILGAHGLGVHTKKHELRASAWVRRLKAHLQPFAFPILRVGFGFALIYASLYAKVIHNQLALAVTARYPDLVAFFGFEPHFLVLGAALVEIAIGLFFVLGIEIRFTSLFLLFWLSLSLWYFGEVVWPHLILIGIPIAFICYGYDKYSLEGRFLKKNGLEPVL